MQETNIAKFTREIVYLMFRVLGFSKGAALHFLDSEGNNLVSSDIAEYIQYAFPFLLLKTPAIASTARA